ncbi:MAG: PDZ domain-containing protein [Phycisphaerales bacterium]|nr:MAG: PDZ domain-containing protein [Phycisphaerales bacterium]
MRRSVRDSATGSSRRHATHRRAGGAWTQGLLVGVLAVAVLGSTLALALRPSNGYAFLDPIIDVESLITRMYVDEVDLEALQRGAIQGMLQKLEDPYTEYVPPASAAEFNKRLTGEYVGIGARILVRDGWLTIVSPLEGSPALRAGLMAEDRVLEIDGVSTQGRSAEECVDLLQGEAGTVVTLNVERAGRELEIAIERAPVRTLSVTGFHRDPGNDGRWLHMIDPERRIAYVRLSQFTPRVDRDLLEAIASFGGDTPGGLGGLILDLRWNPGGGLEEAVNIANLFMEEGDIVSTRGRAFETDTRSASGEGTLPYFPMAVLINEQSASASEIVAGALEENGRAVVVGTRSFGKGSVQSLQRLPRGSGGQLKFTTQRYYLPSGRSLHRNAGATEWGVDPTEGFFVPISDEQTVRLLRQRAEQEIIRTDAAATEASERGRWADPSWVVEELADPQLSAAVLAVQGRIDDGDWTPTGMPGMGGDAIAMEELREMLLRRERVLRELGRVDSRVQELERIAAGGERRPARDLWDDGIELEGGVVIIRDAEGNVVRELRITGPSLERWLIDADVEPIENGGD